MKDKGTARDTDFAVLKAFVVETFEDLLHSTVNVTGKVMQGMPFLVFTHGPSGATTGQNSLVDRVRNSKDISFLSQSDKHVTCGENALRVAMQRHILKPPIPGSLQC